MRAGLAHRQSLRCAFRVANHSRPTGVPRLESSGQRVARGCRSGDPGQSGHLASHVSGGACVIGVVCQDLPEGSAPNAGELLAEKVVQAAVELAVLAVPVSFSSLANAWSKFCQTQKPQGDQEGDVDLQSSINKILPLAGALAAVWPNERAVEDFLRVRASYILGAVKASPPRAATSCFRLGLSCPETLPAMQCLAAVIRSVVPELQGSPPLPFGMVFVLHGSAASRWPEVASWSLGRGLRTCRAMREFSFDVRVLCVWVGRSFGSMVA